MQYHSNSAFSLQAKRHSMLGAQFETGGIPLEFFPEPLLCCRDQTSHPIYGGTCLGIKGDPKRFNVIRMARRHATTLFQDWQ